MSSSAEFLLPSMLKFVVPLWIERVKAKSADQRFERLVEISNIDRDNLGPFTEALLYKIPGRTAKEFNWLAETLALMSFVPGGVRAFGSHWETKCEIPAKYAEVSQRLKKRLEESLARYSPVSKRLSAKSKGKAKPSKKRKRK